MTNWKGQGRISDDPTVSSLGDWEGDETIELGDTWEEEGVLGGINSRESNFKYIKVEEPPSRWLSQGHSSEDTQNYIILDLRGEAGPRIMKICRFIYTSLLLLEPPDRYLSHEWKSVNTPPLKKKKRRRGWRLWRKWKINTLREKNGTRTELLGFKWQGLNIPNATRESARTRTQKRPLDRATGMGSMTLLRVFSMEWWGQEGKWMESEDVGSFVQQTLIKGLLYFRLSRPGPAGNKDSCAWSLHASIVHRMPFKEHSQRVWEDKRLARFFWAERWNQGNCFPQAGEAGVCGWIAIDRGETGEDAGRRK